MYKFVIFSAVVAVCVAQIPLDTPEVTQAKAAHFAAVAEAQARSLGSPIFNPHVPAPVFPVFPTTPTFPSPVFPAAPNTPWKPWDGVPAPIVVANGHVQDTAEVVAEKTKHFTLFADAAVHSANTGPHDDGKYHHDPSGDYIPYVPTPIVSTPLVRSSFAPLVPGSVPVPYQYVSSPVVVANGFIQDTPEVAALKAARVAELQSAGGAV